MDCNGTRDTCSHQCTARCHEGPHPLCIVPTSFTCRCGAESERPCNLPSSVALCPRCSQENFTLPKDIYQKIMEKCKRMTLQKTFGKVEYAKIARASESHFKVSKRVIEFLSCSSASSTQYEVIGAQKIANKVMQKDWYLYCLKIVCLLLMIFVGPLSGPIWPTNVRHGSASH